LGFVVVAVLEGGVNQFFFDLGDCFSCGETFGYFYGNFSCFAEAKRFFL
jgi:hypothetical protein